MSVFAGGLGWLGDWCFWGGDFCSPRLLIVLLCKVLYL